MAFGDHVDKFAMKEGKVVVAGFMWAPKEGALKLSTSPQGPGELDRGAAVLVKVQQAPCGA